MLKKVFHTFSTSLLIAGATFLTTSLLSKSYGAIGLGEIGMLLFACSIISVLSAIFGSSTIVYVLPKYQFGSVYAVTLVWSVLASTLAVLLVSFTQWYAVHLMWLFVISLLQSLYINHLSFLLALNKVKQYNLVRIVQPCLLILLLIGINLIKRDADLTTYFFILSSSFIFPVIGMIIYLLPQFFKIQQKADGLRKVIETFFSFGGLSQVTNFFQLLNYRVSYFILVLFCSKNDVGVMVLIMTIVEGIWLFKNSMSMLKYLQTAIREKVEYNNFQLAIISLVVTLLILILALLMPSEVYLYFFGKDFTQIKKLLLVMSPGILFMAISSIYANYFAGLGKVKFNLVAAIAGFVFFVPIIYFLTKNYGITGAAIANNIPLVIGSLVTFYFNREMEVEKS